MLKITVTLELVAEHACDSFDDDTLAQDLLFAAQGALMDVTHCHSVEGKVVSLTKEDRR